jgi:pyruvate formate lyase activating enzyme
VKYDIRGLVETSMVDWDGMLVSTIFLPGCNFRCPFCHNSALVLNPEQFPVIPFKQVRRTILEHIPFLDGVCVTGGEPLVHRSIHELLRAFRKLPIRIKLDTNGTMCHVLESIIENSLVDYVAMDLKGPLTEEAYRRCAGIGNESMLRRVKESIQLLSSSGVEHEFRTTVVPGLHGPQEIEAMARTLPPSSSYVLQSFIPRNTLDPSMVQVKPYEAEEMDRLCEIARQYVSGTRIRGQFSSQSTRPD